MLKTNYNFILKLLLYTCILCNLLLSITAEKEPLDEDDINTNPSAVRLFVIGLNSYNIHATTVCRVSEN